MPHQWPPVFLNLVFISHPANHWYCPTATPRGRRPVMQRRQSEIEQSLQKWDICRDFVSLFSENHFPAIFTSAKKLVTASATDFNSNFLFITKSSLCVGDVLDCWGIWPVIFEYYYTYYITLSNLLLLPIYCLYTHFIHILCISGWQIGFRVLFQAVLGMWSSVYNKDVNVPWNTFPGIFITQHWSGQGAQAVEEGGEVTD